MGSVALIARSLAQLRDRAFLGAILWAVVWTLGCAILWQAAAFATVRAWLDPADSMGWVPELVAALLALVIAVWLFLPTASAIASLYVDRIAGAVEDRHYPWLPPARPAPFAEQLHDSLALAGRLLALGAVGVVLALALPGLGVVINWLLTGYALGRGMFLAVAMRRLGRAEALALYHRNRRRILVPAMLIGTGAWFPVVNVLVPVIVVATMAHALVLVAGWKPPAGRDFAVDNRFAPLSPPGGAC